jgi:hypothetical protein
VEIAPLVISKGQWETWETAGCFSTFSMARHFHRASPGGPGLFLVFILLS